MLIGVGHLLKQTIPNRLIFPILWHLSGNAKGQPWEWDVHCCTTHEQQGAPKYIHADRYWELGSNGYAFKMP